MNPITEFSGRCVVLPIDDVDTDQIIPARFLKAVTFETGIQRAIAPHLLGRLSAYTWMAAMTFLPLGYATAGWIGDVVGMSRYLVSGAVWIVVATCALMFVPEIRDFRLATTQPADVPAAAVAT